jgi:hypothetical protein
MRNFAIINIHKGVDISNNIIRYLNSDDNKIVFHIFDETYDILSDKNTSFVRIPSEYAESESKIKNYVSKYFFENNFTGFLHVIEDHVAIYNNPKMFLDEIEIMMSKLNMKSWFNTITDVCNYTFNIYNPRISVSIDDPELIDNYNKTIYWASHANTSWVCYDYSKSTFDDVKFDETFEIPMYYIIKFLAERRNNKKPHEMYYMNFYPTVIEERGVFKLINVEEYKKFSQQQNKKEGELFASMKINYLGDVNIDMIYDDIIYNLKN